VILENISIFGSHGLEVANVRACLFEVDGFAAFLIHKGHGWFEKLPDIL
jgi:hypothetical protein